MANLKRDNVRNILRTALFLITLHTVSFGAAYFLATSFDKLFNKSKDKPKSKESGHV